jgi:hypothetical protein
MKPTVHPSTTRVLKPPKDWNHEAMGVCDDLAITDTQTPHGLPQILSFWRPTTEELQLLQSGGAIVMSIIAVSIPPVSLAVVPAWPVT